MYAGTKTTNQSGNYLRTGLSSLHLLGVNPTVAQIQEWTGRENVKEPNYEIAVDTNGNSIRPVVLYLKNQEGTVVNFRINVGEANAVAKSGNYQVCTSTGSVVWAIQHGEVKPEFVDHKPLKIGEAQLIQFIQKLVNFDPNSGENFYQQMYTLGQDATSLYNGSYQGLNNLAKFSNENDKAIAMVLTVREVPTTNESGEAVVKTYQSVAQDPKTWFHGEASDWAINKLKERYEKSLIATDGQPKAYPLINDLFTYSYQEFNRQDCINAVPDNSSNTPKASW